MGVLTADEVLVPTEESTSENAPADELELEEEVELVEESIGDETETSHELLAQGDPLCIR